jgi:ribonuclease III
LKPWITFQDKLGYHFKAPKLLEEALTHKSFAHENRPDKELFAHNERLEFLGDAVLDLAISILLMHQDFQATEGELSKRRASLVNESTLAEVAREFGIREYLILGRGELNSNGSEKSSILASTMEAVFGAVYLDGGFDEASKIVEKLYKSRLEEVRVKAPFMKDYKTRLQELIQGTHKTAPRYRIEKTHGPEHEKVFQVAVLVGDKVLSEGQGKSRKEAEQDAAKRALEGIK